jgi:DNA-binding protein YbaB
MGSISQAKDMFRLQKEAKKIKKALKNIHVEAEGTGVKVVVSGNQDVVSIEISPDAKLEGLGDTLKDCLNRALAKAQVVSSEHMQGVMQQMGMGGGGDEGMKGMAA